MKFAVQLYNNQTQTHNNNFILTCKTNTTMKQYTYLTVEKKPIMYVTINKRSLHVDTSQCQLNRVYRLVIDYTSCKVGHYTQSNFNLIAKHKVRISHTNTKKKWNYYRCLENPETSNMYRVEQLTACPLVLTDQFVIDNVGIVMDRKTKETFRRCENNKLEYIGTFNYKSQIRIPAPIVSTYMCAMCRSTESVPSTGLKEIKGIEHDCCICKENKASILCNACCAIHSCKECVTHMIKKPRSLLPHKWIAQHVSTPP